MSLNRDDYGYYQYRVEAAARAYQQLYSRLCAFNLLIFAAGVTFSLLQFPEITWTLLAVGWTNLILLHFARKESLK